jgi:hypothetical protein
MKHSPNLFVLAVVAVVVLCAVVYRSVRAAASARDSAEAVSAAGLAAHPEPALAASKRDHPRPGASRPPQAIEPVRPEAQDPVVKDPRTDLEVRAEDERQWRDYMAGVTAAFRQQSVDAAWSSATASAVQSALATDSDLRPLARGVECRSRTCRVAITDDGSGKLGKALPLFAQQVGQALPSIVAERIEEPGGGATMILYLSRPDSTRALPR